MASFLLSNERKSISLARGIEREAHGSAGPLDILKVHLSESESTFFIIRYSKYLKKKFFIQKKVLQSKCSIVWIEKRFSPLFEFVKDSLF